MFRPTVDAAVRARVAEAILEELPSCAVCLTARGPCPYCTADADRYARAALDTLNPPTERTPR